MSFLALEGKRFLVLGVANRKSVAYHVFEGLRREGAEAVVAVRSEARREQVARLVPEGTEIHVCDVEREEEIHGLSLRVKGPLHGLVHSVAFADFSGGMRPFHETPKAKFLQTVDISCFSLVALANAFKEHLVPRASVVTLSISTTEMAAENYGWMAPAKAALESSLCFLAKSFSRFSEVRFNAVCPGLLKTSASAGIPGYVESYLRAERYTLRKRALETREVASAVLFLLSEVSSGITAQRLVLDAGMRINYFDGPPAG
jgi:enoyl-[acyl-carrier protein] reductase I